MQEATTTTTWMVEERGHVDVVWWGERLCGIVVMHHAGVEEMEC